MGVDLTLVPNRFERSHGPILGYTRLPLTCRWYKLHEALQEVANPLTEGLMWYADEGIETIHEDAYGHKLTWVIPSQFLKAAEKHMEGADDWDKGVVAFIKCLPPQTQIVLWFH